MKAPDKIYLSVEKGEDWAYAMWTQRPPEERKFSELDEHEEYIRKDELLEWANNELNGRRDTGDDYFHSAIVVLNDLIEKLNSL